VSPAPTRILLALSLAALAVPAAPAVAKTAKKKATSSKCVTLPVSAQRTSKDPIAFQDAGRLSVKPASGTSLKSVKVTIKQGKVLYASGMVKGTTKKSTVVKLKYARNLQGGTYRVSVTGTRSGCSKSTKADRDWTFEPVSLPVIASRSSAYVEDYGTSMRVVLRSVGGRSIRAVTAALLAGNGAVVTQAKHEPAFTTSAIVDLPLTSPLQAGDYTLRVTGRLAGDSTILTRRTAINLRSNANATKLPGGGPAAVAAPTSSSGLSTQQITIDWSDGQFTGRDTAGFVVPGMGYGELVCRPDVQGQGNASNGAQWLRFFSGVGNHQVAMMNWIHRTWEGQYSENALREGVLTANTGSEMNEGFNKFAPPEKLSSGTYEGIISDRGTFGSAGGTGVAPVTWAVSWSWDFSNPGHERCAVTATIVSENTATEAAPLARSLNINWQGESNASGRDGATAIVPGLGRVDVTCAPGTEGVRWVTVTGVDGAVVTTRQNSDESVVPISNPGSVAVPLVNNGMFRFQFPNGASMLMTSRFKVNDPDPTQNFCFIAAQAIQP